LVRSALTDCSVIWRTLPVGHGVEAAFGIAACRMVVQGT
jgi:hypothetical protein